MEAELLAEDDGEEGELAHSPMYLLTHVSLSFYKIHPKRHLFLKWNIITKQFWANCKIHCKMWTDSTARLQLNQQDHRPFSRPHLCV